MVNKRKDKILIYDIETSYTVGAVWGLYDQNVATVLREPYILSVAWKWLGDKTTHVMSLPDFKLYGKDKKNDRDLVIALWKLFDKADIIIAHNGNSFDQKWSYARFVIHALPPPSPAKYVDTKVIAKNKLRVNSNSLNNLGKYFGLGEKLETGGIQLWVDCIENDKKEAWDKMCKYNKQDVVLLEQVYLRLLPFITNHPKIGLINEKRNACDNCGSENVQFRGFDFYQKTKHRRTQCQSCGCWGRQSLTSK
jgi:uncharacterized protein YprB with RNaseH-like and TPR domain